MEKCPGFRLQFPQQEASAAGEGPDASPSSPGLDLLPPPVLLAPDTYHGTFPDYEHPDWHSESHGQGRCASVPSKVQEFH